MCPGWPPRTPRTCRPLSAPPSPAPLIPPPPSPPLPPRYGLLFHALVLAFLIAYTLSLRGGLVALASTPVTDMVESLVANAPGLVAHMGGDYDLLTKQRRGSFYAGEGTGGVGSDEADAIDSLVDKLASIVHCAVDMERSDEQRFADLFLPAADRRGGAAGGAAAAALLGGNPSDAPDFSLMRAPAGSAYPSVTIVDVKNPLGFDA